MEDLCVVRVVYVSKDTEKLAVYVFCSGGECGGKVAAWSGVRVCVCVCMKMNECAGEVVCLPDFVGNIFSSSKRF